jgi:hypothetical protein
MGSLVRFENKNILFYFEKRCSLPTTYNAGIVAVNSIVVGLTPGTFLTKLFIKTSASKTSNMYRWGYLKQSK